MKRTTKILIAALCIGVTVCFAAIGLSACNKGEKHILVISREDGSGTRDAFDGLIKNAEGASLQKDKDGNRYRRSPIVSSAEILSKTGDVLTKVNAASTAIGYISLGSLNGTVKALSVNGIKATADNVLNGSYELKRPFVIASSRSVALTAATADFISYLSSAQAQEIVIGQKYVEQASSMHYSAPQTALQGTVVIKGSTSVDPLMDKLIADYQSIGGAKVSGVEFEKDAQGSSHGISAVKADVVGNVIGMSSSSVKSSDAESLDYFNIALDAVAIIVNNSNALENVTIAQLFDIYTGAVTKFSQLG